MRDTPKRTTYLYLFLTLAFSSVFYGLIIWSGHIFGWRDMFAHGLSGARLSLRW